MPLALQITLRGFPHSDALELRVRRRASHLEHICRRAVWCHVIVDLSHRHRHGRRYRVSIAVGVPGEELAVSRCPPEESELEDAFASVDLAFDEAERQVEDWRERLLDRRREARRIVASGR